MPMKNVALPDQKIFRPLKRSTIFGTSKIKKFSLSTSPRGVQNTNSENGRNQPPKFFQRLLSQKVIKSATRSIAHPLPYLLVILKKKFDKISDLLLTPMVKFIRRTEIGTLNHPFLKFPIGLSVRFSVCYSRDHNRQPPTSLSILQ